MFHLFSSAVCLPLLLLIVVYVFVCWCFVFRRFFFVCFVAVHIRAFVHSKLVHDTDRSQFIIELAKPCHAPDCARVMKMMATCGVCWSLLALHACCRGPETPRNVNEIYSRGWKRDVAVWRDQKWRLRGEKIQIQNQIEFKKKFNVWVRFLLLWGLLLVLLFKHA